MEYKPYLHSYVGIKLLKYTVQIVHMYKKERKTNACGDQCYRYCSPKLLLNGKTEILK